AAELVVRHHDQGVLGLWPGGDGLEQVDQVMLPVVSLAYPGCSFSAPTGLTKLIEGSEPARAASWASLTGPVGV
ncbi:MAG TPA: hypothetical protein VLR26_10390, partial [Frankiaceae bacterium]|nr:hypothetical protein [Frankiaceae bacterium]